MSLFPWRLPRRPSGQVVAGLDLGADAAWLVVLTGSAEQAQAVSFAQALTLPDGLVQGALVLDPVSLGQWLKTLLREQGLTPHGLCLSVDDAWLTRQQVAMSAQLSPRDLAFQLAAELEITHATDPAQVCWTYNAVAAAAPNPSAAQVTYDLGFLAQEPVLRLKELAKAAGLRAWVVEPRTDASERVLRAQIHPSHAFLSALPGPAAVACGLCLAAWAETGLNFLPHRRWARQRRQRAWMQHLGGVVALGAVLTVGCVAWLEAMVHAHQQQLLVGPRVRERLAAAQSAQQELRAALQRAKAQGEWLNAQHLQQQHTVQWHDALRQASHKLWVSHLRQDQARWVVQGEALSATQVQQWTTQLAALPVWQRAPEVHQLQFVRSASAGGGWVWQFRIDAELKGVR
jgi:hypothetical protein